MLRRHRAHDGNPHQEPLVSSDGVVRNALPVLQQAGYRRRLAKGIFAAVQLATAGSAAAGYRLCIQAKRTLHVQSPISAELTAVDDGSLLAEAPLGSNPQARHMIRDSGNSATRHSEMQTRGNVGRPGFELKLRCNTSTVDVISCSRDQYWLKLRMRQGSKGDVPQTYGVLLFIFFGPLLVLLHPSIM